MKEILPPQLLKLNYARVLITSGILFFMGILFGFVTPGLFKGFVKKVSKTAKLILHC